MHVQLFRLEFPGDLNSIFGILFGFDFEPHKYTRRIYDRFYQPLVGYLSCI